VLTLTVDSQLVSRAHLQVKFWLPKSCLVIIPITTLGGREVGVCKNPWCCLPDWPTTPTCFPLSLKYLLNSEWADTSTREEVRYLKGHQG
jgi:hypothetical protein